MDEAAITHAAGRIEAALERLETAARKVNDLHGRHEGLKADVARSLADLDDLLSLAQEQSR